MVLIRDPTLVRNLKLRTQLSFHVPNDLIGVSLFALALLFLGSDFRRMVYPDISLVFSSFPTPKKSVSKEVSKEVMLAFECFLFSSFHTSKKSVSKEVMLAFESFPITPLVRCFYQAWGWTIEGMCTLQNAYINMKLSSPEILRKFYGKHDKSMCKTSLPVSHLPVHCSSHYCSAKLRK